MKNDKKEKVPVWKKEDYDLINTGTRQIVLAHPMHFETLLNILKRIPFPPPLIERLLQGFEREAKGLLKEVNPLIKKHQNKKPSPQYGSLAEITKWQMIDNKLYAKYDSAKRVLIAANDVREAIRAKDAERTAIDTMRLVFAAVTANLHEIIMKGIRAKTAPAKGGRADKEKHGIIAAIKRTMKKIDKEDAFSLWLYFAENHHGYENAFKIGKYKIFFQIDINGMRINPSKRDAAKRGKLLEIIDDDDNTLTGIVLSTFRQYVSKVKNKL